MATRSRRSPTPVTMTGLARRGRLLEQPASNKKRTSGTLRTAIERDGMRGFWSDYRRAGFWGDVLTRVINAETDRVTQRTVCSRSLRGWYGETVCNQGYSNDRGNGCDHGYSTGPGNGRGTGPGNSCDHGYSTDSSKGCDRGYCGCSGNRCDHGCGGSCGNRREAGRSVSIHAGRPARSW